MAQNKSHITSDNIGEWLGSTGFIFPRTMAELLRFEKLCGDVKTDLTGSQIDPLKILSKFETKVVSLKTTERTGLRMAARKGNSNIPDHILDKMMKNQKKPKEEDGGSQEEGT